MCWVHTDAAAAATDLFGAVSKAAPRSLCLCLIIFYHAAYLVGWAQHHCFSCWSDWLWFKGSSEVTFVVFNSLLLCLLTSIVMDFFWLHAFYSLWKVLVVVWQFVGSHTNTHIAADLFGASSEAAAEVTLNLWTNNAFETELPMYNICDTWWLWKDPLNKNPLDLFQDFMTILKVLIKVLEISSARDVTTIESVKLLAIKKYFLSLCSSLYLATWKCQTPGKAGKFDPFGSGLGCAEVTF